MNRDEGAYQLSPIWTQVISIPKPGGRGRLQSDFAHLSPMASDTFHVFQVLIKIADSYRNCQHQLDVKTGYDLRTFKSTMYNRTVSSIIRRFPTNFSVISISSGT